MCNLYFVITNVEAIRAWIRDVNGTFRGQPIFSSSLPFHVQVEATRGIGDGPDQSPVTSGL